MPHDTIQPRAGVDDAPHALCPVFPLRLLRLGVSNGLDTPGFCVLWHHHPGAVSRHLCIHARSFSRGLGGRPGRCRVGPPHGLLGDFLLCRRGVCHWPGGVCCSEIIRDRRACIAGRRADRFLPVSVPLGSRAGRGDSSVVRVHGGDVSADDGLRARAGTGQHGKLQLSLSGQRPGSHVRHDHRGRRARRSAGIPPHPGLCRRRQLHHYSFGRRSGPALSPANRQVPLPRLPLR